MSELFLHPPFIVTIALQLSDYYCGNSSLFSNVKLAMWSLSTAVKLQKGRYIACLLVFSESVKQVSVVRYINATTHVQPFHKV